MKNHKISFFSKLVMSVPQSAVWFFASCIGILWFDILRIRRDVVVDNISKAYPKWDKKKVVVTGRHSLKILGLGIVDVLRLPFFGKSWVDKQFEFEGISFVEEALAKKKGVILLSLHLGSGDMGISALNYLGLKIQLISKKFKSKWLNDYWYNSRGRHGTEFIDDRRSSFTIIKSLKKNQCVIFVLDQFMGPPLGVKTQFFGRETGTAMGGALIALKTGASVVPSYTYVREDGKYIVCFDKEISFTEGKDRDDSIQIMSQKYTDKIEEIVRKHPGQWMWVHKRWKEFKV